MYYCSIDDAWGQNISNKYKEYMNNLSDPTKDFSKEMFSNNFLPTIGNNNNNNINNNNNNKEIVNNNSKEFVNNNSIEFMENYNINNKSTFELDCNSFITHFRKCEKCQNKIRNEIKPNLLISIKKIIDNNNDIIVLILAGLSILLFFNLINNLTKN
jgi:hypothetical protein